jgi:hypothetical protein
MPRRCPPAARMWSNSAWLWMPDRFCHLTPEGRLEGQRAMALGDMPGRHDRGSVPMGLGLARSPKSARMGIL